MVSRIGERLEWANGKSLKKTNHKPCKVSDTASLEYCSKIAKSFYDRIEEKNMDSKQLEKLLVALLLSISGELWVGNAESLVGDIRV